MRKQMRKQISAAIGWRLAGGFLLQQIAVSGVPAHLCAPGCKVVFVAANLQSATLHPNQHEPNAICLKCA
jgi:hypothetical protein